MRKYILWILILLFLGGVFSFVSQSEQGYVLFSLGTTTVETSIWFVIATLVILSSLIWFAIRFIYVLLGYPGKVVATVNKVSDRGKKRSVERMLLAHLSGDYATSEKQAVKFQDKQLSSSIARLMRIEAQIRQGKIGQAAFEIKRGIAKSDKKTKPTFLCLQMELELSQGRHKEVIAIFNKLPSDLRNKYRWQESYWQALLSLGEIRTLIKKLPSPYSYSGRKQERLNELYKQALLHLMKGKTVESRKLIRWYWKKIPVKMQQERFYAENYLQTLLRDKDFSEVEKQLCKYAKIPQLGALMQYWGDFVAPNVRKSLKHLEKLYSENQDQWLGLGLGRLCLQLQLWGKAESYMRTTLDSYTDPEVNNILLITLAKLYHQQGDNEKATYCLNKLETVHVLPSLQ